MSENHRKDQNISARKLAAIMFTDIVGYTSLMGGDEHNAFNILTTNLEIHNRLIKKYNGKIVKELGDGLLSIFENGTEAVQCAIGIQQEGSRNGIPLRIGIHEGEVVFKNNDVFGDGVNIASRIQDEAAKGGICISDSVYRIIKNKTDIDAESIGIKHLKNVDEDIKLYQIKAEGVTHLMAYSNLKKSKILLWPVVIIIAILLFIGGWFLNKNYNEGSSFNIEKLGIVLPTKAPIVCQEGVLPLVISPDGTLIVYQAFADDKMLLYKRYMDQYEAIPISGTEGAQFPFISPDGEWIGFYSMGILKKVLVSGGTPEAIANVPGCSNGTWLPDNTIIFGMAGKGLFRIPARGGTYTPVTKIDISKGEWIHDHPIYLPDDETLLYSVIDGASNFLYIKSHHLNNGNEKVIVQGAMYPMYISSDYLLYVKNGHLMASSFNSSRLEISDPALVLIEDIAFQNPSMALSENGTLAYVSEQGIQDELIWVNMEGKTQSILRKNTLIRGPRISPDGKKIAMWFSDDSGGHVFIYDLDRDLFDKLTLIGDNFWPVWTPDGNKIAFPSIRGGTLVDIVWKTTDKSAPAESLLKENIDEGMKSYTHQPQDWSHDSRYLLFATSPGLDIGWDIMIMDMENNKKISKFIATEHSERHPRISPDDNWLAYEANETGRKEIYITKFPDKGAKWLISTDGGEEPIWSPDGRKLYYRYRENVFVVEISIDPYFRASKPKILFSGKYRHSIFGWNYDIHPDGDKFVMVKGAEIDISRNQVNIIKNFDQELENKFAAIR